MINVGKYVAAASWARQIPGCKLWLSATDSQAFTLDEASITQGNAFDHADWTKNDVTLMANNDGVAERVTVSATTSPHITQTVINSGVDPVANPPCVHTFKVRTNNITWLLVETRGGTASNQTWFRIDGSAAVGTSGANHSNASISAADGGGYRTISVTMNANAATHIFRIRPVTGDNGTTSPASGTYMWLKEASVTQRRILTATNLINGVAYSAPTDATQPGFSASGLNGRPAFGFHTAQYMFATDSAAQALLGGTDTACTIFMVCDNVANNNTAMSFGRSATTNTRATIVNTSASNFQAGKRDDVGGSAFPAGGTPDLTNPHVIEVIFHGTTISIIRDGTNVLTTGACDVGAMTMDWATFGALKYGATLSSFYSGFIGEVIGFTGVRTTVERSYIRKRLGRKWGITVT